MFELFRSLKPSTLIRVISVLRRYHHLDNSGCGVRQRPKSSGSELLLPSLPSFPASLSDCAGLYAPTRYCHSMQQPTDSYAHSSSGRGSDACENMEPNLDIVCLRSCTTCAASWATSIPGLLPRISFCIRDSGINWDCVSSFCVGAWSSARCLTDFGTAGLCGALRLWTAFLCHWTCVPRPARDTGCIGRDNNGGNV